MLSSWKKVIENRKRSPSCSPPCPACLLKMAAALPWHCSCPKFLPGRHRVVYGVLRSA